MTMNNTYCDGMWARFLSSQCLRDDFKSGPKSSDLKHFYRTLVYSGLHESNNHTSTIS